MKKVRIAGERHYPNGKEQSPYAGRWVSPLFDNVSKVKAARTVSDEAMKVLGAALMRSLG